MNREETELTSRKKKEKGEWDGVWESCPGSAKLLGSLIYLFLST